MAHDSMVNGGVNTTELLSNIHFNPDDTSFPSMDIMYL